MPRPRRRAGAVARPLGAVAALVAAAVLLGVALVPHGDADASLRDLDGRSVVLDEAPEVVGADVSATGGRFVVPARGVDVPLLAMTVTRGVLNPPTLTDAFVLRDADRVTAAGTRPLVVAMHAVRDGRAPGNAFFESGAREPAVLVAAGDELLVDGVRYLVERTEVLGKAEAARSAEIWGALADGADRLVVVTCLQRAATSGPAAENLVIHAVRA